MLRSSLYHNETWSSLRADVALIVGNPLQNAAKFFAHKNVLCGRSGYFKTLFASYDGHVARIPNINSHTFAHLLAFMYNGRLELNPLNVYEIFLASDLLHVTDALDLCKLYLTDGHGGGGCRNYAAALSVVKPIPRKNVVTTFDHCFSSSPRTLEYQPLRIDDQHHSSIFKPVRSNATKNEPMVTITDDDDDDDETVANENDNKENSAVEKGRVAENEDDDDEEAKILRSKRYNGKAIVDVACCDGPIRFHKVANKHYDPRKAMAIVVSKNERSDCQRCEYVSKNSRRPFRTYERQSCTKNDNVVREQHHYHHSDVSSSSSSSPSSSSSLSSSSPNSKRRTRKRSENLQCHQCKTCGSKFPSYYFVHKHKKLHHRGGEGDEQQ